MSQLVALVSAPTAPWLLSPTQVGGVIVETACVLATAAPLTVVYSSGSPDTIAAGAVATVYGGTSTPFDRTAGPWLVITTRTSAALQVVKEADLATVTGTFAVLARITRLGMETNPPAAGIGGGGGGTAFQWITKTADYTITAADITAGNGIAVDASGGNVTITLPTAAGVTNEVTIKRIDSSTNTVTIATTSAQTIDGFTSAVLVVAGHSYVLGSTGSAWLIAGGFFPNPLTAKGSIAAGDANGVPREVVVGANTKRLTANSTAADGVDWEP